LLTLVGSGCNRLSEIAGRLGKPAGSLTRPLANLIELGYVRKEVPFGSDARSSKRTLYKINDPFLSFFFRFLPPNQSLLEMGVMKPVEARIQEGFASHVAEVWEDLARLSVPFLNLGSHQWGAAGRWWGVGMDGTQIELDVVAQSMDRKNVLVGEAKWSGGDVKVDELVHQLHARAAKAPFVRGRKVTFCVWLKRSARIHDDIPVITPDRVLRVLR
jgi:AAA+ ATPase superfamily predicted ATPase